LPAKSARCEVLNETTPMDLIENRFVVSYRKRLQRTARRIDREASTRICNAEY